MRTFIADHSLGGLSREKYHNASVLRKHYDCILIHDN